MKLFLYTLIIALLFSSIGFKKYVWFISIGYGFTVAAIGVLLLILGAPVPAALLCRIYLPKKK